jgi:hypothetical protein
MKRSIEPTMARCSITGCCFCECSSTYSASRRSGIMKSTCMVPTCQARPIESFRWYSILGRRTRPRPAAPPIPRRRTQRPAQHFLGAIPEFVGADALFRSQRELDREVGETEVRIDLHRLQMERGDLGSTCSGVQKMWPSSCVKARTRMMPCSAPDGSLRWQPPNSP